MIRLSVASSEAMEALGERIGASCLGGEVIALRGGLAAGKTTLTKGIARGLGIAEEVTSPTFTLINDYVGRLPLHHLDAYRLSGAAEFEALGTDEILTDGAVSVIEWSERVDEALPPGHSVLSIETKGPGTRSVSIEGPLEELLGHGDAGGAVP